MKIVELDIKSFRGFKNFNLKLPSNQNVVCLIGRGDSGKSSILEAIYYALNPNWNLSVLDTDFHNANIDEAISIEVSLLDPPPELLTDNKFGLNVRMWDEVNSQVVDDFETPHNNHIDRPVLTIRFTVDSSLEPSWWAVTKDGKDDVPITANDRMKLGCSHIADYIDRHFSWSKGGPLNRMLKLQSDNTGEGSNSIVLSALREAKSKLDEHQFDELSKTTQLVKKYAGVLGLELPDLNTTIDFRDISMKDGKVSLHESNIPLRLRGKGSRRLASLAIQSSLLPQGGLLLVDEIEQGLEPDRAKHIVRTLKDNVGLGQIFLTTHSREVITELAVGDLLLLLEDQHQDKVAKPLEIDNDDKFQKAVRACPEAFFVKKIVVCEGATEVGIMRAFDKWRVKVGKVPLTILDCAYIDGNGSVLAERVDVISETGFDVAVFCDSDVPSINDSKVEWEKRNILILDCEPYLAIEQQIFRDICTDGLKSIVRYAVEDKFKGDSNSFFQAIGLPQSSFEEWLETYCDSYREIISEKSIANEKKAWFKAIHHGEYLGDVIFENYDRLGDQARLRSIFDKLGTWLDA